MEQLKNAVNGTALGYLRSFIMVANQEWEEIENKLNPKKVGRPFGTNGKREQVLELLYQGLIPPEIAGQLKMPLWTVRSHIFHIRKQKSAKNVNRLLAQRIKELEQELTKWKNQFHL